NGFTDLAIPLDSEPNDIQSSADGILFVSCLQHIIVIKNDVILKSHPMPYEPLSCSFSNQQQQLAVLTKDNIFFVYQYSPDGSLKQIYKSEAYLDLGSIVRYSPDGKFLAVTAGRYLFILNPHDNFSEVKKSSHS
uniref:hypothetical protein n=1 Tax=Salmonella sp. s51228 TaxID=3159652 RepID=UPI00397EF7E5